MYSGGVASSSGSDSQLEPPSARHLACHLAAQGSSALENQEASSSSMEASPVSINQSQQKLETDSTFAPSGLGSRGSSEESTRGEPASLEARPLNLSGRLNLGDSSASSSSDEVGKPEAGNGPGASLGASLGAPQELPGVGNEDLEAADEAALDRAAGSGLAGVSDRQQKGHMSLLAVEDFAEDYFTCPVSQVCFLLD